MEWQGSEVGHAVTSVGLLANESVGTTASLRCGRYDNGQGLETHGRLFKFPGEKFVLEALGVEFLSELRPRLARVRYQHRVVEEGTC